MDTPSWVPVTVAAIAGTFTVAQAVATTLAPYRGLRAALDLRESVAKISVADALMWDGYFSAQIRGIANGRDKYELAAYLGAAGSAFGTGAILATTPWRALPRVAGTVFTLAGLLVARQGLLTTTNTSDGVDRIAKSWERDLDRLERRARSQQGEATLSVRGL